MGRGGVFTKLWGILTGLLVIGVIVYLALLYQTGQGLSAEVKLIRSVNYNLDTGKMRVIFVIEVNNTGYIDVDVEKLYYEVYIDGEKLGEGVKDGFVIHVGTNTIELYLDSAPSDAIKALFEAAKQTGKPHNVTVKGYVDIPIKSFGVVKLWTARLPFEKTSQLYIETYTNKSKPGPHFPGENPFK